jgi:hypothetical protein
VADGKGWGKGGDDGTRRGESKLSEATLGNVDLQN